MLVTTMFPIIPEQILPFANAFNLDWSKILSFGKDLTVFFSFSHNVVKSFFSLNQLNTELFGKGLK